MSWTENSLKESANCFQWFVSTGETKPTLQLRDWDTGWQRSSWDWPWEISHLTDLSGDGCVLFFFFFGHTAWHVGSLVPWPGIEPKPPALGIRSLNHWTIREVSDMSFFAFDWKGETLTQVFQSKTELQKAFLTEIMEKNLNTWNKPADKLPCNLKNSDVLVLGNVDNLLDNTVLKQNPEMCECVGGERYRENRREITVEIWPPH